ncbi:MAG: DJ-1/PfpI family protein [Chloroflexi bacterium]|nr:DJ-1/PfpI family protein [Chloroflexota bacterium]
MKRVVILIVLLSVLIIGAIIPALSADNKVLFIIAPSDFRDEEYFTTKNIVERGGFQVDTASTATGEITGVMGGIAISKFTLDRANIKNYIGVVFIGGPGAQVLWDNADAQKIGRDAKALGKPIGAICFAPVIIARAGILKNVKATCWPGVSNEIIKKGATYIDKPCVRDGKIVTGSGPAAAEEFGKTVLQVLKGK